MTRRLLKPFKWPAMLLLAVLALLLAPGTLRAQSLAAVFSNDTFGERDRVCSNDGSGNFTCADASSDAIDSRGVALGDLDAVRDAFERP